jgi:hypothetical protein
MLSDLNKHPEFKGIADKMGPIGLLYSMSGDVVSVRRFIEGFR